MAKFKLWKSINDGDYYWHLWSDNNNKVICRSSEGYSSKQGAEDSIEWVKKYAAGAKIE